MDKNHPLLRKMEVQVEELQLLDKRTAQSIEQYRGKISETLLHRLSVRRADLKTHIDSLGVYMVLIKAGQEERDDIFDILNEADAIAHGTAVYIKRMTANESYAGPQGELLLESIQ